MRQPNNCSTCDHCNQTTVDRYGEQKLIREASKWTCYKFPRQGVIGVVDGAYILPEPYVQCWKVRQLCPDSCPLYKLRIPGQKSLDIERKQANEVK